MPRVHQPGVAAETGFSAEEDGTFWMELAEWADLFTSLAVCRRRGRA